MIVMKRNPLVCVPCGFLTLFATVEHRRAPATAFERLRGSGLFALIATRNLTGATKRQGYNW